MHSDAPTIRARKVAMIGGLKESDIAGPGEANFGVNAFGRLIRPHDRRDRPDLPLRKPGAAVDLSLPASVRPTEFKIIKWFEFGR